MNSITKQWVRCTVSKLYSDELIDEAVEVLDKFFSIVQDDKTIDWNRAFEDMAGASDLDKKNYIKNFADIERFLKLLARIVFPGKLDTPPYSENPSKEWTMSPLLRRVFHVVPKGIDLQNIDYDVLEKKEGYEYFYLKAYEFRNAHSHVADLNMSDVSEVIKACLITELSLCEKYKDRIIQEYNKCNFTAQFDKDAYLSKIVKEYSKLEESGFKYVDTMWAIEDEQKTNVSIKDLLKQRKRTIKLLGEPGTGKSTAMIQLRYELCQQILKHDSDNYLIPILIELMNCNEIDGVIKNTISSVLNVDSISIEYLLEQGRIVLLLDGYNEILDLNVKKRVAHEIDRLAVMYPLLTIIVSDRSKYGENIPILQVADIVSFLPLSKDRIKSFITSYYMSEDTRAILLDKFDKDEKYFDIFITPLKLICLFNLVEHNKCIPDDFIQSYIQFLFERESFDKKDPNMEYVKYFLEALAAELEKDHLVELSKIKVLSIFKNTKDALGFEKADTRECLKLSISMNILTEEEQKIRFSMDEYSAYFLLEGMFEGIEDLLNE